MNIDERKALSPIKKNVVIGHGLVPMGAKKWFLVGVVNMLIPWSKKTDSRKSLAAPRKPPDRTLKFTTAAAARGPDHSYEVIQNFFLY